MPSWQPVVEVPRRLVTRHVTWRSAPRMARVVVACASSRYISPWWIRPGH